MSSSERLERVLSHLEPQKHVDTKKVKNTSSFRYTVDGCDLTLEDRMFYEKNGYIVLKGLLSQSDMDEYIARFDELCSGKAKKSPFMAIVRDVSLKGIDRTQSQNITKIQGFHDDPILRKYTRLPQMVSMVKNFTGPALNSCHTMLINKPPDPGTNSSRHPPHQDLWYFPFRPADKIVACWSAMQTINDKNGCLYVVPGSHRDPGLLHFHGYPSKGGVVNKAYHQIMSVEDPKDLPLLPLHMEAGDTVFFHPLLYHGSGPNFSNGFRKAISCHYSSEDCHFIDVHENHVQKTIADEVAEMSKYYTGGAPVSFIDVWRTKSRHIAGGRYCYSKGKFGPETENCEDSPNWTDEFI